MMTAACLWRVESALAGRELNNGMRRRFAEINRRWRERNRSRNERSRERRTGSRTKKARSKGSQQQSTESKNDKLGIRRRNRAADRQEGVWRRNSMQTAAAGHWSDPFTGCCLTNLADISFLPRIAT
eukprot:753819-Hanusia_phi.AAC.6